MHAFNISVHKVLLALDRDKWRKLVFDGRKVHDEAWFKTLADKPSGINVPPVRRRQIAPARLAIVHAAPALAYTAMEDVVSLLDTACIVCNRLEGH
jgi:hypothetical protein